MENELLTRLGTDEEEAEIARIALLWIPFPPRAVSHSELTMRLGGRMQALMIYTVQKLKNDGKIVDGPIHGTYTQVEK